MLKQKIGVYQPPQLCKIAPPFQTDVFRPLFWDFFFVSEPRCYFVFCVRFLTFSLPVFSYVFDIRHIMKKQASASPLGQQMQSQSSDFSAGFNFIVKLTSLCPHAPHGAHRFKPECVAQLYPSYMYIFAICMCYHRVMHPYFRFITIHCFRSNFRRCRVVGGSQAASWRPLRHMTAEARHHSDGGYRGWPGGVWGGCNCMHICVLHSLPGTSPPFHFCPPFTTSLCHIPLFAVPERINTVLCAWHVCMACIYCVCIEKCPYCMDLHVQNARIGPSFVSFLFRFCF